MSTSQFEFDTGARRHVPVAPSGMGQWLSRFTACLLGVTLGNLLTLVILFALLRYVIVPAAVSEFRKAADQVQRDLDPRSPKK